MDDAGIDVLLAPTVAMSLIEVHHHILPPRSLEAVGHSTIASQGSAGKVPHCDMLESIGGMDAAGITSAVTSISAPGFAAE